MPWGDRRGPRGLGPRTGKGAGYCSGYSVPGFMNPAVRGGFGRGRGMGFGRGRGRGFGRGFGRGRFWRRSYDDPYLEYPEEDVPEYYRPYPYPKMKEDDELKYLNSAAESLENELKEIKARIKELTKPKEK